MAGVCGWPWRGGVLAAHRIRSGEAADDRVLGAQTSAAQSTSTAAFVLRLRELGWIDGSTVAIEYRWAEGRGARYAEFAAEFGP